MSEVSKHLPNNEKIAKFLNEGGDLGELAAHHEITLWGLLMLVSEIGASYYILQDKLIDKGVLTEEDIADMKQATENPEYLQSLYMYLARVFHEKCERVVFATHYPEEIAKYVERKVAGENPEDPMRVIGEDNQGR